MIKSFGALSTLDIMPSCQASTPSVTVADVREVDGNAVLFLEEPQTQTPSTSGASRCGWLPGHNTIGFMSRGRSIHEQAQCLLVNAVEVCHRVRDTKGQTGVSKRQRVQALESCSGRELLVELRKRIRGNDSKEQNSRLVEDVVGGITCLPSETVRSVWNMGAKASKPASRAERGRRPDQVEQAAAVPESSKTIWPRLVRIALANARMGRPRSDFCHDLLQLKLAGSQVGQKYLNKDFTVVAETVASRILSSSMATLCAAPLPGLGIPSATWQLKKKSICSRGPGTLGRWLQHRKAVSDNEGECCGAWCDCLHTCYSRINSYFHQCANGWSGWQRFS